MQLFDLFRSIFPMCVVEEMCEKKKHACAAAQVPQEGGTQGAQGNNSSVLGMRPGEVRLNRVYCIRPSPIMTCRLCAERRVRSPFANVRRAPDRHRQPGAREPDRRRDTREPDRRRWSHARETGRRRPDRRRGRHPRETDRRIPARRRGGHPRDP